MKQGKPDKRSRAGNPTGRYFTWGKTDDRILSAEIRKKALLSDRADHSVFRRDAKRCRGFGNRNRTEGGGTVFR